MKKGGDYQMAGVSREHAIETLSKYSLLRPSLRRSLVSGIESASEGIPAVVIANLGGGLVIASVVNLGAYELH
jgi:hypothetical protein